MFATHGSQPPSGSDAGLLERDPRPMTKPGAFPRLLTASLALALLLAAPLTASAQTVAVPAILSPQDGAVLKGTTEVRVATDVANFASAELAFAYDPNPTGAWFLLQTASVPATEEVMTTWDTAAISDGDYLLRLRVTLLDGSSQDATVHVKVRNYTVVPTETPESTPTRVSVLEVPTPIILAATATATQAVLPPDASPTALPANPAGISSGSVFSGFWRGALAAAVLVLLFGAFLRLRR